MDKLIEIDVDKCTGCRICELACSLHHERRCIPSKSRIHAIIWAEEGVSTKACKYEALWRDPATGAVLVMEDSCIGCKMCLVACPYGCMGYDKDKRKAFKCDLCGGDPACCKACPTKAIEYIKADKTAIARKRGYAKTLAKGLM
jgi:Fe-S-cluster-containing hydrogenase component 2